MDTKQLTKLMKKYSFLKKKTLPNGIECDVGWNGILLDLFKQLNESDIPANFKVVKVFSKMNELRVHTINGTNTTRMLIEDAAEKSAETCEGCGNGDESGQCAKCQPPTPFVETDIDAILHPSAPNTTAPVCACVGACVCGVSSAAGGGGVGGGGGGCSTCGTNPCVCCGNCYSNPCVCSPNPTSIHYLPSSNPADYYFKLDTYPAGSYGGAGPQDIFTITPQAFWNANNYLYDQHLPIDTILENNGFGALEEGLYNFDDPNNPGQGQYGNPQTGRQLLLNLGLVENLNLP